MLEIDPKRIIIQEEEFTIYELLDAAYEGEGNTWFIRTNKQ